MINRDEYRQMLLAGAVTFPATFPQVGRLTICSEPRPGRPTEPLEILAVEEYPSPRVTLSRRVLMARVRAVFLPRSATAVQFTEGEWLLEDEVSVGLKQRLAHSADPLYGIVFIPENEPSMLHVSAGMTAAESSQYYPPLPGDPSHNHYNPWPATGGMDPVFASALAARPKRFCAASDVGSIFMQACSNVDALWEVERAKAIPTAAPTLQEITAACGSESLINSCTVSHMGVMLTSVLEPSPPADACTAIQPFPTDDLEA